MLKDKEINLDLPIDAYDAEGNLKEKPSSDISEDKSTEVSQTEDKKEVVDDKKEEEQRVPYSRFDKVRREKEEAVQRAEEAIEYARSLTAQREVVREASPYSSYEEQEYAREIKTLYGDNPAAERIIEINLKHQRAIGERAERRALQAIEARQYNESRALAQNENVIDSRLEQLSERVGRELTEKEQDSLLEIVDEYTPTGPDGKYAGEILPFDKAWEIYEMKQERQASSSKKARSQAVRASGSPSQGEPSGSTAEQNKEFNPRNWKSLYDRIGKFNS